MSEPTISSPSREGVRDALAVALMNIWEGGEPASEHGYTLESLRIFLAEKHDGDCTRQPYTCNHCVADIHLGYADKIITHLGLESLLSREKDRTVQGGEGRPEPAGEVPEGVTIGTDRIEKLGEIDLSTLKAVVEYRRRDMSSGWNVMAAFDQPGPAERYAAQQRTDTRTPWVYRWRSTAPPAPERKDDWIPWSGGECPVSPNTVVEVQLRTSVRQIKDQAGALNWIKDGISGDIIAYRPVTAGERT